MDQHMRARFWVESALAAMSAGLFALTLVWHNWIELVFRVDPDQGSGSLEWAIVAAALILTVAFAATARREWRRAHLAIATSQGAA